MFRGFGIEGRIAGNVREKQRALQAAESAQQYAEWWLTQSGNAASLPVICNAALNANAGEGQICANTLPDLMLAAGTTIADVGAWPFWVTYTPPTMSNPTSPADSYYQAPQFYISDLGGSADGAGEVFQIDATGYGASASTLAVVESTFIVQSGVVCNSCAP